MEIIVPAAGLSTRFPNMKPKYLLYDYKGDMMLMNALRTFRQRGYRMHIGILKEHEEKYNVIQQIQHEWSDNIKFVVIDKPTRGPADTVYQIIKASGIHTSEIFIKDCDSFFEHDITEGDNYVCVTKISQHEILKKLASKSFTIANENGIITDIVEKEVVSDTFCVGGYKFSSAMLYKSAFEQLKTDREVFVSDVIGRCISNQQLFTNKMVTEYVDVGTADDWFQYNDKPVIFCDIDGTIIQNQSRVGPNSYKDEPIPLSKNVKKLLEMQKNGAQFIFTTARPIEYTSVTREMLYKLGFMSFTLLCGLQNSRRILINDYNEANPYPRAVAINLYRNDDRLSDFL
jgi:choline kinase